jgi:hypothetical protein
LTRREDIAQDEIRDFLETHFGVGVAEVSAPIKEDNIQYRTMKLRLMAEHTVC